MAGGSAEDCSGHEWFPLSGGFLVPPYADHSDVGSL